MSFEKFSLALSHTKIGDKFIEYLEEGDIPGTECKGCNTKYYPPRSDCCNCNSSEMKWIGLDTTGELLTFTCINVPGEHFQNFTPLNQAEFKPFPIGVLRLDSGLNVMGWIPEIEVSDLKVGMTLEASPEKVDVERLPLPLIRKCCIAPDISVNDFSVKVPEDFEKESIPDSYYTIVLR